LVAGTEFPDCRPIGEDAGNVVAEYWVSGLDSGSVVLGPISHCDMPISDDVELSPDSYDAGFSRETVGEWYDAGVSREG